ncbi:acyltransferase family protein [Pelagibius sp. Alg239-R121]|uniref:acyltransferase family protein n=1 Tax=Pelagibius sp. Alg239-R121 TaxID=2993448 RepID=UPI0024A7850F|nr:acyltransferase family protein [Pelagibius sp. Alg239-R121]
MQYRREIDGLRAVAVVPVILFHAGFEAFSGGFIGVDVFFVISGYLITTIIYREIQEGDFSLVRFYERRVRRILPALMFVSMVCIPFAWLWMLPDEFAGFARSLVAVNIFASNILFLQESSKYFSSTADLMPMIHTWSLSVEEQFYFLFPLFILVIARSGRVFVLALLVVLAALSLGVSDWGAKTYPLINFYLLPTRAWELGIGAILAIGATSVVQRSGWVAQSASAIGLAMVIYPFFFFSKYVGTPSFWTLIPVIGTALTIVFGRQGTVVGKILGWKPVVGIGLISYSAYLWHQPIFAFARIRLWGEVSDATYLSLSILALILAYFSWRFVERPFRNKSAFNRKMVFSSAAGFSAALIAFGVIGHKASGFPWRHGNEALVLNLENRLRPNRGLDNTCNTVFKLVPECRTSDEPEIIVWGDSHAMHLVNGIIASNPDAAIVQMTKTRCAPILDVASIAPPRNTEMRAISCLKFNENVKNYISTTKNLKFAVLASPLTSYLKGDAQLYFDGQARAPDVDFLVERFKETLDWLQQNNVSPVVFQSPPSNGKNAANCIARSIWFGANITNCNRSLNEVEVANATVDGFMSKLAKSHKVVRLKDYICKNGECIVTEDGVFIYMDSGHLSHEGSRLLGEKMDFYGVITGDKSLSVRQ